LPTSVSAEIDRYVEEGRIIIATKNNLVLEADGLGKISRMESAQHPFQIGSHFDRDIIQ
jgi:hypothetical protein